MKAVVFLAKIGPVGTGEASFYWRTKFSKNPRVFNFFINDFYSECLNKNGAFCGVFSDFEKAGHGGEKLQPKRRTSYETVEFARIKCGPISSMFGAYIIFYHVIQSDLFIPDRWR